MSCMGIKAKSNSSGSVEHRLGYKSQVVDKQETWLNFSDACRAFDKAVCIGVQASQFGLGLIGLYANFISRDAPELGAGCKCAGYELC